MRGVVLQVVADIIGAERVSRASHLQLLETHDVSAGHALSQAPQRSSLDQMSTQLDSEAQ